MPDESFAMGPPPGKGIPHYCLRCGARLPVHDPLADLPGVDKCPRCGLPFVPGRSDTYATVHAPFYKSLWFNGLVLPVIVGVICFASVQAQQSMGYVLFLGVPFVVGVALGFLTNGRAWMLLVLGLTAVSCLAFMLISMSLAGAFCGLMLAAIFLGPVFVGLLVGCAVKWTAGEASWDRRRYAILGVIALLPMGGERIERRWPPAREVVEVRTSALLPADCPRTWHTLQFYEEVTHEPPLLLKLALPRPVRVEGAANRPVGHALRCVYRRGYLEKVIIERDEPRRLAFLVTEQRIGFESEVALLDGRFELKPAGASQCRVTVATRYRRLLRPAWLWEPTEHLVIHTLHRHVLEGMRRRLAAEDQAITDIRKP